VSTSNDRPGPIIDHRRSQRILLGLAIQVSGQRANGAPFTESTRTKVVNAHGALIQLHEMVLVGQKLRIKNLGTNEELVCEVVDINPGENGEVPEVGIAFTEPTPRFWRVAFPPRDWSYRNPEAKRFPAKQPPAEPTLVKK
jgi:hypothetical protein